MINIRGLNDVLVKNKKKYLKIIFYIKKYLKNLMFNEIETPIIEPYINYNKKNNIFFNELYKFKDYNKKILCLRPEGTTFIHRIYKKIFITKIFYTGKMFRYEKPQLNKLRQFNQIGIEIYNKKIFFEISLIKKINVIINNNKKLFLEINSYYNYKFKFFYLLIIIKYLEKKFFIRILKQLYIFKILEKFFNFKKFVLNYKFLNIKNKNKMKKILFLLKILFYNPMLSRGINYYSGIVFEWKIKDQKTICGGGNYGKFSYFLNKNIKNSFGLSIGIERFVFNKNIKKKKFKIYTLLKKIYFFNIYYCTKNANLFIKKINFKLIKILFKKKFLIIKKKNYFKFIKKISNEI